MDNVAEFSNSVNSSAQRILGRKYSAGTLFLMPFSVSQLVTYKDDGYTVQWKYYQVDMTIRYCAEGWKRVLLNVGNRARFGNNKAPENIYQYHPYVNGSFAVSPVWTDAVTYHAHDAAYRQVRSESDPQHVPYEFGENIPLTSSGNVNTTILHTDITSDSFSGYPSRSFNEFKTLNWRALNIPSELKNKWN